MANTSKNFKYFLLTTVASISINSSVNASAAAAAEEVLPVSKFIWNQENVDGQQVWVKNQANFAGPRNGQTERTIMKLNRQVNLSHYELRKLGDRRFKDFPMRYLLPIESASVVQGDEKRISATARHMKNAIADFHLPPYQTLIWFMHITSKIHYNKTYCLDRKVGRYNEYIGLSKEEQEAGIKLVGLKAGENALAIDIKRLDQQIASVNDLGYFVFTVHDYFSNETSYTYHYKPAKIDDNLMLIHLLNVHHANDMKKETVDQYRSRVKKAITRYKEMRDNKTYSRADFGVMRFMDYYRGNQNEFADNAAFFGPMMAQPAQARPADPVKEVYSERVPVKTELVAKLWAEKSLKAKQWGAASKKFEKDFSTFKDYLNKYEISERMEQIINNVPKLTQEYLAKKAQEKVAILKEATKAASDFADAAVKAGQPQGTKK